MTIPVTTECTPRSLPGYRDKRGKILTPGLRGHIDRKNRKHWIIPELWGLSLLVVPITMDTGMESQQKEKESSQIRFQLHWRNILVRNWAGPTVEGKHARVDEGSIRPRIYLALGKNASTSPFAVLWTRRRQTSMSYLLRQYKSRFAAEYRTGVRDNFREVFFLYNVVGTSTWWERRELEESFISDRTWQRKEVCRLATLLF